MTSVIQRDRKFEPGEVMTYPHRPSDGGNLALQVQKAAYWLGYKSYDTLFAECLWGHQMHDPLYRFLDTTLNRTAKLFTRDNVETYVEYLKRIHPDAPIQFLPNGLGKNDTIEGVDPLFVITGKERKDVDEAKEDEDWIFLDQSDLNPIRERKETIITYPFVYPSTSILALPHIVIIVIDMRESKVWYYDSQGLTSDDPSRLGIFKDDLDFNMHNNLVQLAKELFQNEDVIQITENLSIHQIDPFNCGTLICRVLKGLYEGKSVEEAFMFNPLVDSPSQFKIEAGHQFLQALNLIPGPGSIFDVKRPINTNVSLEEVTSIDLTDHFLEESKGSPRSPTQSDESA